MIKLLIADDERIVRNGLASICDWNSIGITLCSTASNGRDAYHMIMNENPDIVLIDIKMPFMNGIEIIREVAPSRPDIRFIILSGYGEFEYAKEAMSFGVSHFLLKPCNNVKVLESIEKVKADILSDRQKNGRLQELQENMQHILPGLKEQFLCGLVGGRFSEPDEMAYYLQLMGIEDSNICTALLEPAQEMTYEKLLLFLSIIQKLEKPAQVLLSSVVNQKLFFVFAPADYKSLFALMHLINEHTQKNYGISFNCAVCDNLRFNEIPAMYRTLEACLIQEIMLDGGGIITPQDIVADKVAGVSYAFDYNRLVANIRGGNVEQTTAMIEKFYEGLSAQKAIPAVVRAYSLQLFSHIVNQANTEYINEAINDVMSENDNNSSTRLRAMIRDIAVKVTESYYNKNNENHSHLVREVLSYAEQYLADERLSISWIASELLYINVDYLGKIVKSELGERLSSYLLRRRIEAASKLLSTQKDMRVYEVARQVGFGDNAQYFSAQFKKITGLSPREYSQHIDELNA